jgi:hypothetical protein
LNGNQLWLRKKAKPNSVSVGPLISLFSGILGNETIETVPIAKNFSHRALLVWLLGSGGSLDKGSPVAGNSVDS